MHEWQIKVEYYTRKYQIDAHKNVLKKQKYFSSFKIDDADGKFSVKYIYPQFLPFPFFQKWGRGTQYF